VQREAAEQALQEERVRLQREAEAEVRAAEEERLQREAKISQDLRGRELRRLEFERAQRALLEDELEQRKRAFEAARALINAQEEVERSRARQRAEELVKLASETSGSAQSYMEMYLSSSRLPDAKHLRPAAMSPVRRINEPLLEPCELRTLPNAHSFRGGVSPLTDLSHLSRGDFKLGSTKYAPLCAPCTKGKTNASCTSCSLQGICAMA
jgi:hypothetical protein